MNISMVTLTGADDSVDPNDLLSLFDSYPFVEWGILFSQSKSGVERYPSLDWVDRLLDASEKYYPYINLAAHLCGKWVDDALKGEITFLREHRYHVRFNRIQLNMSGDRLRQAVGNEALMKAIDKVGPQVILGGNYSAIDVSLLKSPLPFDPLFDASGGRGIATKDWPAPFPLNEEYDPEKNPDFDFDEIPLTGYAGGLGPDNLVEELAKIELVAKNRPIWIDMESKIRTNDKFDLDKCRQVLKIVDEMNKIPEELLASLKYE